MDEVSSNHDINQGLHYLQNQPSSHHRSDNTLISQRSTESTIQKTQMSKYKVQAQKAASLEAKLTPRSYQLELLERAKSGNIIAVVETGSGKTFVAVMLIKDVLLKEKAQKAQDPKKPHRVAIFLVNSVPLVNQQSQVIANNLPFEVEMLFGEMGVDLWKRDKWDEIIGKADVIVMTAQILLDLLRHSNIKLEQICLLIFDECHHTRKNHPYNLIMTEFYHRIKKEKYEFEIDSIVLPKIFSMTASPMSKISNVVTAANYLEISLDSKIFTINYNEELREHVSRPREIIVRYNPPPLLLESDYLVKAIKENCAGSIILSKLIKSYEHQLKSLGKWCALLFFIKVLEGIFQSQSDSLLLYNNNIDNHKLLKEEENILLAQNIYISHQNYLKDKQDWFQCDPEKLEDQYTTPKVKALLELLYQFSINTELCSIIFTDRKDTAIALVHAIKHTPRLKDLIKCSYLVGHSSGSGNSLFGMNFTQQNKIVDGFRKGDFNTIIATNVAEEGLDIQPCNLVVRFNGLPTLISYIQSRGRARHQNSNYIILQETGDYQQTNQFDQLRKAELALLEWCRNLPSDRLLKRYNTIDDLDLLLYEKELSSWEKHIYKVESTEAIITLQSSIPLIYKYCDTLPHDDFCIMAPRFVVTHHLHECFKCTLYLPSNAPINSIDGAFTKSKLLARQYAAWKMCIELHKLGELDDYLLPVKEEIDENDIEPVNSDLIAGIQEGTWRAVREYNLKEPNFWSTEPKPWTGCYLNILDVDELNQTLDNLSFKPFAIITRSPLPVFDPIQIFFKGQSANLKFNYLKSKFIQLDEKQLHLLLKFSLVSFEAIFNKKFICDLEKCQYFFAPIKIDNLNKDILIDWDTVHQMDNKEIESDLKDIEGLIVIDKIFNGIRYKVKKVRWDMNPNCIKDDSNSEENASITFKEYYQKKLKQNIKSNQPLLEVEKINIVLNYLVDHKHLVNKKCKRKLAPFLIPELTLKYYMSMDLLNSITLLPSLMSRVDALLLVHEAKQIMMLPNIKDQHLLEAFTLPAANLSMNYERLELLGDSFLKFITSIYLFVKFPNKHEGQMHCRRIRIIGNRYLFRCCKESEWFKYVNPRPFTKAKWRPPNFESEDKSIYVKNHKFKMSDKGLADIMEAILGAAVLSGGENLGLKCAKALNIITDDLHDWEDIVRLTPVPKPIERAKLNELLDLTSIEEKIGYKFKSPSLLVEAFTHASSSQPLTTCYQRLEFLGDAVLDYLVTSYLFQTYPDESPGGLTEIKGACVANNALAVIMETLGVHKNIIHNSYPLFKDMNRFIDLMEVLRKDGKDKQEEYWYDVQAPKAIADVLEAILGAVMVDSKFDISASQVVFDRIIKPIYDKHLRPNYVTVHPSVQVSRYLHRNGCNELKIESYFDSSTESKDIATICEFKIHQKVVAISSGKAVRQARKRAAQVLLDRFNTEPDLLKNVCVCPSSKFNIIQSDDDFEDLAGIEQEA